MVSFGRLLSLVEMRVSDGGVDGSGRIADPMVGFWCRVGSLALTHTHNDIAILVQQRTLLSIFYVKLTVSRC